MNRDLRRRIFVDLELSFCLLDNATIFAANFARGESLGILWGILARPLHFLFHNHCNWQETSLEIFLQHYDFVINFKAYRQHKKK